MRPLFGSSLDDLQSQLSVYTSIRRATHHERIRFWCDQELLRIWWALESYKVWC